MRGTATLTDDPAIREQAVTASTYSPKDRYILFVLMVEFAFMNTYDSGEPNVQRWEASE